MLRDVVDAEADVVEHEQDEDLPSTVELLLGVVSEVEDWELEQLDKDVLVIPRLVVLHEQLRDVVVWVPCVLDVEEQEQLQEQLSVVVVFVC